ncbi:helix-turn-helix domain-containing protein [Kurthia senegalensis]|uniref:helix-turn-helix domain-containing protein n=1 Tax=Kurthia senegalensis TaxID=1033740 RepID=UPI000288BE40|nr:helix-turn-helix transcriptional regulator [Kurthia senegalensis]
MAIPTLARIHEFSIETAAHSKSAYHLLLRRFFKKKDVTNMGQHTFNKDDLAENLKNLRTYCRFKTLEVADFLNLTSSAYGYYETGRSTTFLEKLIKLAILYGVAVEDLMRKPSELMENIVRELNLTEEQLLLFKLILNN